MPRYLSGTRTFETHIYKRNAYPYDLITPLTVIWKPQSQSSTDKKGKGKEVMGASAIQSKPSDIRSVWLRFHPSVHTTVLDILKEAASYTLAEHKRSHEDSPETKVDIINLQGRFNVFEIMGPRSSQVIHGCLTPDRSEDRAEFSQVGPICYGQST